MSEYEYLGISDQVESELKLKSSRFLSFVFPVFSEENAESLIRQYRMKYANASHVCYAYLLHPDRSFQKFSDAGEPSNSAGRPMLNVLLSSGISFALAIVVRYFGGKKLGVPGLIEAYGSSVKECLAKAEIRNLELRSYMRCSIDAGLEYLLFNLQEMNPDIELSKGPSYFEISCSQSMTHELRTKLQNMSTLKFIDE